MSRECPKRSELVDKLVAIAEIEDAQYEREGIHPNDVFWKKLKPRLKIKKKRKKKKAKANAPD